MGRCLIKLLKAKGAASLVVSATAKRFVVRIGEKPPTWRFSEGDMSLAGSPFDCGKMSPPSLSDGLSKEFLFLPQGQNEDQMDWVGWPCPLFFLTKSVQLERMFLKSPTSFSVWSKGPRSPNT